MLIFIGYLSGSVLAAFILWGLALRVGWWLTELILKMAAKQDSLGCKKCRDRETRNSHK